MAEMVHEDGRPKCGPGPGKYEGEDPIVVWLEARDGLGADDTWSEGEGGAYAGLLHGPFEFGPDDVRSARAEGWCDDCIDRAAQEFEKADSAIFQSSSDGFLSYVLYDTRFAAEDAWSKLTKPDPEATNFFPDCD